LPICLRNPNDPGYPPSDEAVTRYFQALPKNNDLAIKAHAAIACFLGALHETMHASLVRIHTQNSCNGRDLRKAWHKHMETNRRDPFRQEFFADVVEKAEQESNHFLSYFVLLTPC
jgi:hypothetical protein